MLRSQLEHVLRAAGTVVDEDILVVIGSQAILASNPNPPPELTVSAEADVYPRDAPEKADLITGSLGEFSMFHETFGYHVDGVSPTTAVLPPGWEERLVILHNENTRGVTGLCLAPVDIAISKLVAGRPKDLAYVRALFKHALVDPQQLLDLAEKLSDDQKALVQSRANSCRA